MKLLPALLLAVFAAVPPVSAAAAEKPAAAKAPAKAPALAGDELDLVAPDGWKLKAVYKAAEPGKLTLVLLHGRGQKKEVWIRLSRALTKAGYGYIAPDLRGHGQSQVAPDGQPLPWKKFRATKTDNDFANMALDVQACVQHLVQNGAPEETVGLIGDALGGSIALKYAAVHPKAPLIVMLSPGLAYQEIPTVNAARAYKERPILMVYGELDKTASAAAPVLHAFLKRSAGEKNAMLISVPNTHGTKILNNAMAQRIVEWLGNPVVPETPPAASTPTAPGQPNEQMPAPGAEPDGSDDAQ